MALSRRAYVGVTVTLTSNAVVYNVLALVQAIIEAESKYDGQTNSPGSAREMTLQAPAANTGTVFIGDALLAAAGAGRCGGEIAKGTLRHYGTGDLKNVDLGQIYASPATNGDKLYVELLVG